MSDEHLRECIYPAPKEPSTFYLSYPIAGVAPPGARHWSSEIKATINAAGHFWFDPGIYLEAVMRAQKGDDSKVAIIIGRDPLVQHLPTLDNDLFADAAAERPQAMLAAADKTPNVVTVTWRNTFVLLRSRFLIVDIGQPSLGGVGADVQLAHLIGAYIIGVTDNNVQDPTILARCNVTVRPHELGALLEVLAHGHPELQIQGVPQSDPAA